MTSNTSQIAKNAVFLYFRKGISILIGLYAARLLLRELGDADYGLYGVVGSIVIMFNALRYLFADSVQRYINVAKGEGNNNKVSEIFSVGVNVHILLSIIVIIAVEIGGIFLVPKLNVGNVPAWQVQTLFQFSILTSVVTIMTVPYDAVIIANEKFNAYAYLSIIDILLRLGAVVALIAIPHNKVIWYAALILAVALGVRLLNMAYCKRAFKEEVKYIGLKNKALTIEMAKFSGWIFFGNFGYWVTMSGTDLILNRFGGLIINASRSIANQIFTNFQSFIGDLNTSFRPRCMILYSEGEMDEYYKLAFMNSRTNFLICSTLGLTFITFANFFLRIWLGNVPEYAAIFCQTILLYSIVRSLRGPFDIFFKVAGKLKYFQISECIITLLNLPISWIALAKGAPLYSVFVIMTILEIINFCAMLLISTKLYGFRGKEYIKKVGSRILLTSLILTSLYAFAFAPIADNNHNIWVNLFLCLALIVVILVIQAFTLLNSGERNKVFKLIQKKCGR